MRTCYTNCNATYHITYRVHETKKEVNKIKEMKECPYCGSYYNEDEYGYCPYCNEKEREKK